METLYRKVAVSEEPKHNGNYHCIFPEGHIFTIPFLKEYGFHEEFTDCSGITHYLEEIPDPTAQLKADKEEMQQWKDSALEVMNQINLQEVGKVLNLKLGSSVSEQILPSIKKLIADKAELLEALGMSLRLNKAFGANSEWIEVQEIESLIQKMKQ